MRCISTVHLALSSNLSTPPPFSPNSNSFSNPSVHPLRFSTSSIRSCSPLARPFPYPLLGQTSHLRIDRPIAQSEAILANVDSEADLTAWGGLVGAVPGVRAGESIDNADFPLALLQSSRSSTGVLSLRQSSKSSFPSTGGIATL